MNGFHKRISQCKKGEGHKRQRLATEESRAVTSRGFSTYRHPLNIVLSFKYLGRMLLAADYYWPAVIQNLSTVRMVWRIMPRILSSEGVRPRVSGFFFKAIQSVFLFGAETWVVTPHMGHILGVFQYQVAQ